MEYATMINKLYDELILSVNNKVKRNELLKNHTYFKIGGPADIFIEPENTEELKLVFDLTRKYKTNYYVIGNGTNILFADDGYKGVIIKIGDKFNYINEHKNAITVGSGTLLSLIAKNALKNSLTGFEFASGIPGFVGGAVCMNAGAYGGEMKDVIKTVKCIDTKGNIYYFNNEEMNFTYRNSRITGTDLIILEAEIKLQYGDKIAIEEKMKELNNKRISKQPLSLPSAGSSFKRPENGYASKLIEDAGLKGLIYKGAMVSDKHSGFIVNIDNASCEDVLELMRIVIRTVKNKFGITLEPEVKIIGTSL